jgi:hypothetical protein
VGAAALAITGLLVAGCGETVTAGQDSAAKAGQEGGTALAAIQQSVSKVDSVHSVQITEKISASGMDMTMKGGVRYGDAGFALSGQMNIGGTAGAQLSQVTGGAPLKILMTGDTMYMNLGNAIAQDDGGKPWVSMNVSKATNGLDFSKMSANMNPAQQLQELIAAGDLHKVGQATVDGQTTTHYAGTVDPATMTKNPAFVQTLGQHNADLLQSEAKQLGMTSETVDVWVNGNSLPVRETFQATAAGQNVSGQIDLSGWGSAVDVTPPPASQTTQLPAGTM